MFRNVGHHFYAPAIFYGFEKGLHEQHIGVAVGVQKMVESEVSGIAFSVRPVTEDKNQMVIEAGFGLGEAIVSGQITPDSYVVEKQPRRIIDKNISEQNKQLIRASYSPREHCRLRQEGCQAITGSIFQKNRKPAKTMRDSELSELILKSRSPWSCDISDVEKDVLRPLQSRPITTLSHNGQKTSRKDGYAHTLSDTYDFL